MYEITMHSESSLRYRMYSSLAWLGYLVFHRTNHMKICHGPLTPVVQRRRGVEVPLGGGFLSFLENILPTESQMKY